MARRTHWLPNASEERKIKVHRVKVTLFQLPSASPCLERSRSPKQRWPCGSALAGGTRTTCKQIFPPEFQGYLESPFEFVSIAESNFQLQTRNPISPRWRCLWHLFGHFHKKFSGKHSLRETEAAAISWGAGGSPQVWSMCRGMFLWPWHTDGHCCVCCWQKCLGSSSSWGTAGQHPRVTALHVRVPLLCLCSPLGKLKHWVWGLFFQLCRCELLVFGHSQSQMDGNPCHPLHWTGSGASLASHTPIAAAAPRQSCLPDPESTWFSKLWTCLAWMWSPYYSHSVPGRWRQPLIFSQAQFLYVKGENTTHQSTVHFISHPSNE